MDATYRTINESLVKDVLLHLYGHKLLRSYDQDAKKQGRSEEIWNW